MLVWADLSGRFSPLRSVFRSAHAPLTCSAHKQLSRLESQVGPWQRNLRLRYRCITAELTKLISPHANVTSLMDRIDLISACQDRGERNSQWSSKPYGTGTGSIVRERVVQRSSACVTSWLSEKKSHFVISSPICELPNVHRDLWLIVLH